MEATLTAASLILGMIFGSVMLAVTCLNYHRHRVFALGGSVLTVFGVLLLSLSIWKTVGISLTPQGGIEAKFSAFERKVVEQVESTGQKIQEGIKDIQGFQAAQELREYFRSARQILENSGKTNFTDAQARVNVLRNLNSRSGHAWYFAGEIQRITDTKRFTPKSCPKRLATEDIKTLDKYRQDFYRYLEVEKTLSLSETRGDTGSEICYQQALGYCSQRTGWIHHLLANDFYQEAVVTPDVHARSTKLARAKEHAELAREYYPPNGFEQCTDTGALLKQIDDRLKVATGREQR